ncbi:MAG: hypothetical protein R3182_11420, partial [Draconibacterium sp.]|nr:hypothetical protein [Draconibacterium sp.]
MKKKLHLHSYLIALFFLINIISCETENKIQAPYVLSINEGFTNPIGFYDKSPTFSWKLPVGVQAQSAYSIVVASSPDLLPHKADLWQSNKINSEQNLYVEYEGKELASRQRVYWQVKFWDNNGVESDWSDKAFFELGLLNNQDWKAKWINLPNQQAVEIPEIEKKVHRVQYLRNNINLQDDIEEARLYITA